ncbi:MAG: NERD domain-containing protein [Acidimicrobiia bacterium]|nr:NERD domain-containing protein [Acidimicrobiia bacterium]
MAETELDAARARKPFWLRLLGLSTGEEREAQRCVEEEQQRIERTGSERQELGIQVQRQQAGAEGEKVLVDELATLSDEWVMLCGYRNRGGETDHVIVGPLGVWAVEVKAHNVRLNVVGDKWSWERLDRAGNVLETQPATDSGGRTWARQVNDVADQLAALLERNDRRVLVRTAVMLTGERAQLGTCENPEVDLVSTRSDDLVKAMTDAASPLDHAASQAIVELIKRDHRYHNAPQT